jgi:hypothetical protein
MPLGGARRPELSPEAAFEANRLLNLSRHLLRVLPLEQMSQYSPQQWISLGFTRVKALYFADNFGTNWAAKGYPVAKGR